METAAKTQAQLRNQDPLEYTPGRRDLMVVRVLYFFFFAGFGLYTAYANLYFQSTGLSGLQIGWLSGQIMLVGMLTAPVWGYINDRLRRPRITLFAAGAGASLGVLLLGSAPAFSWLLAAAAFFGVFYSTLMPLIDQANMSLLGERREQYARQRIWGTIGFIVSTFVSGTVFERVGLAWVFPTIAAYFLIVLLVALLLPRRIPGAAPKKQGSPRAFLRQPAWVLFMAGVFMLTLTTAGMNNFLGIHIRDLGGTEELVGMAFSIGAVAELPIMFFSPFLLRKLGIRSLILIAVAANVLRFLLYMVMPSAAWAVPIALLNALTFGAFWVAVVVYANKLSPAGLSSTGQSLLTAIMSFASVAGASASGWIYDARGGAFLFGVLAVFALASLLAFRPALRYAQ